MTDEEKMQKLNLEGKQAFLQQLREIIDQTAEDDNIAACILLRIKHDPADATIGPDGEMMEPGEVLLTHHFDTDFECANVLYGAGSHVLFMIAQEGDKTAEQRAEERAKQRPN